MKLIVTQPMYWSSFILFLRENKLSLFMFLGMVVGVALAEVMFALRPRYTQREIMYVGVAGEIYVHMLKGLGLMLLPSSLIFGLGNLDRRVTKGIAAHIIIYYMSSLTIASLIAILFTIIIQPGSQGDPKWQKNSTYIRDSNMYVDHFLDIGRNMFPGNLVGMFIVQAHTSVYPPLGSTNSSSTDQSDWTVASKQRRSINMIGITTSALAAGIALRRMGDGGKPLLDALYAFSRVAFSLNQLILVISPALIVSLVGGQVLAMGGIAMSAKKLGMYLLTHTLCLLTYTLCVPMLVYVLIVRQNPFKYLLSMSKPLLTAFATSSSLASLPIAMKQMEQIGYDGPIVHLLMPIGMHLHKNGDVLSFACGAIFVAQLVQWDITWDMLISVTVLSIAASISVVGVPRGGVVGQVIVLDSLDLPVKEVALLLTVDLFADRLRAVVTVIGNCVCTAVLINYNKKRFSSEPPPLIHLPWQSAEPSTNYEEFHQPNK